MDTKIVATPVLIGAVFIAIGVALCFINRSDICPNPEVCLNFGKAGICFGISIIFAVLAALSFKAFPLFIFTMLVTVGSFIAFLIFLANGIGGL